MASYLSYGVCTRKQRITRAFVFGYLLQKVITKIYESSTKLYFGTDLGPLCSFQGNQKFIWKIHFCNFFVSKFLPLRRQRGGRVEDGWKSMDEGPMEQGMKDQWNKDRRKDYRKVYRAREIGAIEKICYRQ